MIGKIFLVLTILFLFSCSDDSSRCSNKGQLCSKHMEDYFECKSHEYYNTGPYGHTEQVYLNIWYKVKDNEDEWTYWNTYLEMYNHFCR